MANHGYLPHNGVATIDQYITQTYKVFGMSADLAGFLAVYGAVFDGDLVSWSIGGPQPSSLLSPLAGLLGQPTGLSGSHNKYESDASPTRGDQYMYGNGYKLRMEQFKALYALQGDKTEETSNYDLSQLTSFRQTRFRQSITENPNFFNGPFPGVIVQPAAYTFIFRFMANKSAEFPEGRLSQNVLKSFFGVTGDTPDKFEAKHGYERIPDNWYKRAVGDEYTIPFFALDVAAAAETYPQFLDIGGNLGKKDSFTPIDITNITGGLENTASLAKGNNALCFVYELIIQQGPDVLEGLVSNVGKALGVLNPALGKFAGALGCPRLNNIQIKSYQTQLQQYPGVTQLKPDGTY